MIFLYQMINLDQIFRMRINQTKYRIIFSAVLAVASVFFTSFSPHTASSDFSSGFTVSVPNATSSAQSYSYEPVFDQSADSVIIPLKRAGRLFLIEAKVDGEAGNLVFDTGANGLVLNSTYFRNHSKSEGGASNAINGSMGTMERIFVNQIEFADLTYRKLAADVANLGHIENRRGVKILGLVGFCMMRNLEVVIDATNNELKLFRIDKSGKRLSQKSAFKPDHTQKMEGNTNILFMKGVMGGKVLNFCLDTGAETNTISRDLSKKVMSTLTITRRAVLKGVGTAGNEVLFGRMNDFSMGNKQMPGMEMVITNLDALSEVYGMHIDGMLGYNFMEHTVMCVNFVNKQLGIRFMKGKEK